MKTIKTRCYTFTEKQRKHIMPFDDDTDDWTHLNPLIYLGEEARKYGFEPGTPITITMDYGTLTITLRDPKDVK